ncbi:MAG: Uncharacterized protein G01um101438_375 [Parcubacteria group bacterium Gr01-1014_38]|nr:MAG: Uncharacterized protein G01um101438_375 [Parcubacteria group bacterium Gr01-1014_38]
MKSRYAGFTLIELLIVIAIIGILAAVVIIAVNPGRQLAQANDARRSSEVNALLNAIGQYGADNTGQIPRQNTAPGSAFPIDTIVTCGTPALPCVQVVMTDANATCEVIAGTQCLGSPTATARVNLPTTGFCADLSDPDNPSPAGDDDLVPLYLTGIPIDPQAPAIDESDYYVNHDPGTRRITVGACNPQIQASIEVTR